MAPQAIATSVFLEKQLTVPDGLFPPRGGSRDLERLPQILKGHIFVVVAREGTRMGGAGRKHEYRIVAVGPNPHLLKLLPAAAC